MLLELLSMSVTDQAEKLTIPHNMVPWFEMHHKKRSIEVCQGPFITAIHQSTFFYDKSTVRQPKTHWPDVTKYGRCFMSQLLEIFNFRDFRFLFLSSDWKNLRRNSIWHYCQNVLKLESDEKKISSENK